jgi:hypothetical protein
MAEFTAIGEVVANKAGEMGVRIENEEERQAFWREQKVDLGLGWFDPKFSAITIGRPQDVASCKVGDRVSITVKVVDRSDGKRGIRTVGFQVLEPKPAP